MNEFRYLLDRFWVTRSDNKDLYFSVKRALPHYRRLVNEQLGWNLIVNESVIKLEKVPPKAMSWGIAVTIVLASVAGLCLLAFGGKWLIIIGLACIAFAFLYTTILSYCGLGDLLVLVFFGLVPVVCTYYVQSGTVNTFVFLAALGSGFAINALLVVNNYRDREADKKSGKNTIIVRFGERFGQTYYLATGVIAVIFALSSSLHGFIFAGILPVLYLPMHIKAWRNLVKINKGKELNKVLGMTSANMMMYAFLVLAGFILDGLV